MKKLLTTLIVLLISSTFAFAFGVAEEDSVDVTGVIDGVETSEDDEVYALEIVSDDSDESWMVAMSASEFDRFDLEEDAEIDLTAAVADDDRLEVKSLTVDGEEFEVDRTGLQRSEDDDEDLEVDTEDEDD